MLVGGVVVWLALSEVADTACEDEPVPTGATDVPLALLEAVAEIGLEAEPVPTGIPLLAAEVVVRLALREGADTTCEDEAVPIALVDVPLALVEAVAEIKLEVEPVATGISLLAAEVVVMLALREGADTTCEDEAVPIALVDVPLALFEAVAEIEAEVELDPVGIPLLVEEPALAELTSVGAWLVVELEDTVAEEDVVMTDEELVLIEDEDEDELRLLEVAAADEDGVELTLLDEVVVGEAELVLDEVVDGEAELVLDEVVDGEAELELDEVVDGEAELELLEVVETTDELELREIAAASPQRPKSESQLLPQ